MKSTDQELWFKLQQALQQMVDAQIDINRTVSTLNELVNGKDSVRDYEEGYADALQDIKAAMYHECFEADQSEDDMQKWDSGNWFRYKLFENVMERLEEENDDKS